MNTQDLLPGFVASEAQEAERAQALARKAAITYHLDSLKVCWPRWNGPKVGGRCEVGACVVHSLTHDQPRYHFSAPCRILEISEDGETLIVEIDYSPDSPCAHYNGERLRLDITEVWAPVRMLTK